MSAKRFKVYDPRKVCASKIRRYIRYTLYMCTTHCMIGSVFTSGVCVCVFRMLFEKPVLLTADHWYTAVACVSSPSGASSDSGSSEQDQRGAVHTAHVQVCTLYIYLHVCTHNVYLMYTSYLSSSISIYMYMYKT